MSDNYELESAKALQFGESEYVGEQLHDIWIKLSELRYRTGREPIVLAINVDYDEEGHPTTCIFLEDV